MFSQASVCHSVHNRPHVFTRSLLILVTAQSTCILLECFLVVSAITIAKALCLLFYLLPLNIHIKYNSAVSSATIIKRIMMWTKMD